MHLKISFVECYNITAVRLTMSNDSKQMLKALVVWLVIVVVVTAYRYSYYTSLQLDKSQYLAKLKELGYDISNADSAIANAKTKATELNKELSAAFLKGYNACGTACAFSRNRNTCCTTQAHSSRSARLSQMPKTDQDLISYYNRYTTNYESKVITEGIAAAIGIPIILLCIVITGGRY